MKKIFNFEIGSITDIGLVRENNEDSYAFDQKDGLFVIADGLGGYSGGEVASKLAVNTIMSFLKKDLKAMQKKDIDKSIKNGIKEAHELIAKESIANSLLRGMGTTLVLALFKAMGYLYITNVGDSRAYLYRSKKLSLLSEDHSLVSNLVKQGKITKEESWAHPQRNIVTSVIGIGPLPECYQKKINLRNNDIVILCSDGLWDMLPDKEIENIVAKKNNNLQNLCQELVDAAKNAGGEDNITIIAVKVTHT